MNMQHNYFTLTFASASRSNLGLKKYLIPLSAPSSVRDLARNMMMRIKGIVAVKYLAFAEDFILFHMAKYTKIQAHSRQATSSHLSAPKFSIPVLM